MPMMYIKSSIWSGFEIKNWIEDQFQSSPKLVGIWTVLRCIFVPNLEIVTSIGDELWHAQAQNGVNFDFGVQFDLEGQGQSPQNNRDLNQGLLHLLFKFGDPSLNGCWVIARTSKCLPHTQTDGRTDGQATTIPQGQNWPRVKNRLSSQSGTLSQNVRILDCFRF